MKLYQLAAKKVANMDILKISKPYTKALMEKFNEVVHLVVRYKNNIVYIDKVEADNTIRMASNIGKRRPLYCTSVGKAMMAYMSNEEINEIWENSNIERFTENTITNFEEFKNVLEKAKESGYAEDDEETELG